MRVSRVVLLCVAAVTLLVGAAATIVHLLVQDRVGSMQRIPDPFVDLPASERPAPPAEPALTVLLAGIDSGLDTSATGEAGRSTVSDVGRSDAMMLVRLTADRRRAYVISLPRDSWVDIPGRGPDKLNASYAFGGAGLAVRTVEQLTGVRIDHVAVVDLAGFRELTDALGGVDITVPEDAYDPTYQTEPVFRTGTWRFDGETALRYVRQRYGLPRGDLDRMRRQQQFLRAIFEQIGQQDDPRRIAAALNAATKTITVDAGFSATEMMRLLVDFRRFQGNITFLTTPVKGVGQVGDASVIFLDAELGPPFWKAVADDDLEGYLANHDTDRLTEPPR